MSLDDVMHSIEDTVRDVGRVTAKVVRNLPTLYRDLTDPIKPKLDRIVDPIAFTVASNATLATTFYYFNDIYVRAAVNNSEILEDIANNNLVNTTGRIVAYGSLYGYMNLKHILPFAEGLFYRKTEPDWKNHAKTWLIALGAIAVLQFGGVKHDVNRFWNELKNADSFEEYVNVFTSDANIRILDRYFSGQKNIEIQNKISETLDNQLIKLEDFGFTINRPESQRIEKTVKDSRVENPNFSYEDKVSQDALEFVRKGFIDTPEQLAFITRVGYWEAGFDPKARNDEDIKEGLRAVFSVMYNRWKYDTIREQNGQPRGFSKNGDNLFDVVFHHGKKNGHTVYQFTAIRDRYYYFLDHVGTANDIHKDGKINIAIGQMDPMRTDLVYEALIEVLSEQVPDNTRGSLYYQNPRAVDRHNRNWENRYGVRHVQTVNSHQFYRPNNLPSDWSENIILK